MIEEVTGFQFCEAVVPEDGITQADVDAAVAEVEAGYAVWAPLLVGDLYQGGIVFQINEDGTGLVANLQDLGEMDWLSALEDAGASTSDGYNDWYLPSIDELQLMYSTIGPGADNIGGFESCDLEWYWSSSEYGNYSAWTVNFISGFTTSYGKNNTARVRIIRAF